MELALDFSIIHVPLQKYQVDEPALLYWISTGEY